MAKLNVHLPDLVRVDVTMTGVTQMRVRLWVATRLIKLAAWLLGGVGSVQVSVSS